MKLSDNTISILKNFSDINPSLWVTPGNVVKTVSMNQTIIAEAEVEEKFPIECGLYDLPTFLGNISLLNTPDLDFKEKHVLLKDDNFSLEYRYCPASNIVRPPEKFRVPDKFTAKFKLSYSAITKLIKLASLNGMSLINISGQATGLIVKSVVGKMNGNEAKANLGPYDGPNFSLDFKIEYINLLPIDYDVTVYGTDFSVFENIEKKVRYVIAPESET